MGRGGETGGGKGREGEGRGEKEARLVREGVKEFVMCVPCV